MTLDALALLSLSLLLAKFLTGVIPRSLRIPANVLELLMGVLLANCGFAAFKELPASPTVAVLALIGGTLLAFRTGLMANVADVFEAKLGLWLVLIATGGSSLGLTYLLRSHFPTSGSGTVFVLAAVFSAVSLGLIAHGARRYSLAVRSLTHHMLALSLVGNLLALFYGSTGNAIVSIEGAAVSQKIVIIGAELCFFVLGIYFARTLLLPKVIRGFSFIGVAGTMSVLLTSFALLANWVATAMSLIGIVGAFALGLLLDEVVFHPVKRERPVPLEAYLDPLLDFLVPIFFVVIGLSVDLAAFSQPGAYKLFALYLFIAVVVKFVAGWSLRSPRLTTPGRWLVIFAILSPGEIGLYFAGLARPLNLLNGVEYSVLTASLVVLLIVSSLLTSIYGNQTNQKALAPDGVAETAAGGDSAPHRIGS